MEKPAEMGREGIETPRKGCVIIFGLSADKLGVQLTALQMQVFKEQSEASAWKGRVTALGG